MTKIRITIVFGSGILTVKGHEGDFDDAASVLYVHLLVITRCISKILLTLLKIFLYFLYNMLYSTTIKNE